MEIYAVGGAVRDALLGLEVKDRDWVVVGARPEEMLAQGFRPVGKDFPVFLHPQSHEEYALARTERKTAPGYTGFSFHAAPDVTLNGPRTLMMGLFLQKLSLEKMEAAGLKVSGDRAALITLQSALEIPPANYPIATP